MKKLKTFFQRVSPYLLNQTKVLPASYLFLSLLSLVYCREISGYFANYNREFWFDYFVITERFSMMMLLFSVCSYLEKEFWFIKELILYFLIQDFFDRVFFDIQTYGTNDIIGLVVLIIRLIFKTYESRKSV